MVTAQELKQIFLFKDVPDPLLKRVAEAAEVVTFAAGEQIIAEGQPAKALVLVRSGTVRATREGLAQPVTLGSGQSFGQMSLLDGGPAGMTAVAVERVDAIALNPSRLAEMAARDPRLGLELFRAVAKSLAARLRLAIDAVSLAREG